MLESADSRGKNHFLVLASADSSTKNRFGGVESADARVLEREQTLEDILEL